MRNDSELTWLSPMDMILYIMCRWNLVEYILLFLASYESRLEIKDILIREYYIRKLEIILLNVREIKNAP